MARSQRDESYESTRTRSVLNWLNAQPGVWAVKFHGSPFTKRGVPDILCCWHGIFVAIEMKRHKSDEPSKLQERRIDEIRDAGGIAFKATNLAEVKRVLADIGG